MAQKYTGKTVEFVCQPKRLIFCNENSGFRIYSVTVDQTEYPDVVVHPMYRTATISGNKIFELDFNMPYLVKANETNGQYGIGYEVISIQVKPLETHTDKLNFLSKVLTKLQASTLLTHYPDIIEQIRTNPKFEPDYKLLKGITPNRFERIRMKINDNYEFADICAVFYDSMTINVIKKLKKKYGTVDLIKGYFDRDPYDTLCQIDGIGFKKADAICLAIEEGANKMKLNKQEPTYEFPAPITNSVQRCRSCMLYCMEELENAEGSTRINLEDLKGKVASLIGACVQHFSEAISNKRLFHLDEELETVSLVSTYKKEVYIVEKLTEAIKTNIDWKYEGSLVTSVNGEILTDEQVQTQKEILENNVVLLTGSAGCVDADTEFFDGEKWKKISEYQVGDKVLQYEEGGMTSLVSPLRYIKSKCDAMYLFETKYGVSQCLSPEHNVIYTTQKLPNKLQEISAKDLYEKHQNSPYGFNGNFLTTFKTFGTGIDLSDAQIKLMCAVICDGNFYTSGIRTDINMCRFHIKKDRKKQRLRQIIEECKLDYREKQSVTEGYTDFYVIAPRRTKIFDEEWYNCSQSQLRVICENIMFWDGNENISRGGKIRRRYSTTIKENADFIQYC